MTSQRTLDRVAGARDGSGGPAPGGEDVPKLLSAILAAPAPMELADEPHVVASMVARLDQGPGVVQAVASGAGSKRDLRSRLMSGLVAMLITAGSSLAIVGYLPEPARQVAATVLAGVGLTPDDARIGRGTPEMMLAVDEPEVPEVTKPARDEARTKSDVPTSSGSSSGSPGGTSSGGTAEGDKTGGGKTGGSGGGGSGGGGSGGKPGGGPGNSGGTPGHSGGSPGNSGGAPGHSGKPGGSGGSGKSDQAPGHTKRDSGAKGKKPR